MKRQAVLEATKQVGPAVNAEKLKYMYTFVTRHQNTNSRKYFESVTRLKHLRATAIIQNYVYDS
jgi:hypothetical protein